MFDGPAFGVTPSPTTRRAAADTLAIFRAAGPAGEAGSAAFAGTLGRMQLARWGLIVGTRRPGWPSQPASLSEPAQR